MFDKQGFLVSKEIKSKSDFVKFAQEFGTVCFQKDDVNRDGVVTLHYDITKHKYGFTNDALFPHTDRSNMLNPPDLVLLWYERKAEVGGESLIFDASLHLLPVIDDVNFIAKFASENDPGVVEKPMYDNGIFRFRNDAYINLLDSEKAKFEKVKEIISNKTEVMELEQGDCLVADNKRIFHGRRPFTGDRIMHRMLVYR